MMKKLALLFLSMCLATGAYGVERVFRPTMDAMVRQDQPNVNYAAHPNITYKSDKQVWAYLQFDTRIFLTINGAYLSLYNQHGAGSFDYYIYSGTFSWAESTITWNNRPLYGSYCATLEGLPREGWASTRLYNQSTGKKFSICLRRTLANTKGMYCSKEHGIAAWRPSLYVSGKLVTADVAPTSFGQIKAIYR